MRKAARIVRARPDAPDVVARELLEAQAADERPGRRDPCAVRAARDIRVERAVVVDHHHAVARDADIELERRDAHRGRPLEAGERVLGRVAARAAVALEVESLGCVCHEEHYKRDRPCHAPTGSSGSGW
jgi:hypothetical protein